MSDTGKKHVCFGVLFDGDGEVADIVGVESKDGQYVISREREIKVYKTIDLTEVKRITTNNVFLKEGSHWCCTWTPMGWKCVRCPH